MFKKRKLSLYWLIVFIFLTVAVIPLVAVGITALNAIAEEREKFTLNQINNQVNRVVMMQDEVEELLQRIAPTNTTRDLLLKSIYNPVELTVSSYSMVDYLILVNDALPPPHTIDLVSLESVVYSTQPGNIYTPEMIQSWVKSIPAQKSQAYFLGNLGIDQHYPNETMVTTIQPVYRSKNAIAPESIIGFLVVHYSFDGVFKTTNGAEVLPENNGSPPMIEGTEESLEENITTTSVPGDFEVSLLDSVNTSILVDSNNIVLSDSQGFVDKIGSLDKILEGSLADSGKYSRIIDGEKYQVHYHKIDEINAYLIDVTPANLLTNVILPYRGKTLAVLVLCLAMILLFGFTIRFLVLAPIFEIVKSLNEIQKGTFDWDKRIKHSWLQEFDELVSLFNHSLDSQDVQKKTELALKSSESKYRSLFMNSPIPLVEEDLSGILDGVHEIGLAGEQLLSYLRSNHDAVVDLVTRIRIIDANQEALKLLQARNKEEIQANLINIYTKYGTSWFVEQVLEMVNRTPQFSQLIKLMTMKHREMSLATRWSVFPENLDAMDRVVISMLDVTEQEKSNKLREALLKISQDADMVDSIQDLYESIHRTLARLMDVSNFYIANYDEATGIISFPYFVDEFDPTPPDREFGNGWTELVVSSGKPVLITEPMVKTILLDDQSNMGTEPLCWLGVPLIVKEKTIGVVAVQSYSPLTSYTPEDRDVLMIIANQIALAISEKMTEAKLIHASTHDELTGLYNRAYYEDEVLRLKAGRNEPVGVIMMDIDGLKFANDHFGHAAGDLLIRETAKILHEVFRSNDVIARIGGDEFAVLLPESNLAVVQEAISRVMNRVATHKLDALPVKLSLSIGGCTTEEHTLQEAIILADQQMYRNKSIQKMKNARTDQ